MKLFSKLTSHTDLVTGMASRLGADLGEMILRNPDTEAAHYRSMVMKCTGCRNPEGCKSLLEANDRLDEAPNYCVNKADLEALCEA
ncbi:hypothetical protein AVO45_06700 [Ruegeria marisrubri]|uniref:DUF6455 domain-containing protein n=1 Tax=Ruegeria marisrubri TaxID=1685379 RepID=A0A0X3U1E7_9RHOB|nr:DUF6455 family protein [Ruegeria marisrubri]KUJ80716.1 hypothetical protein AVO45_06700 [Ruegeria marisrubri]